MYKNKLLMIAVVLGNIPKTFLDLDIKFKLSLFSDRVSRIDFFLMYYTNAINFLILAYCVHYNKYIDKRISKFVLTVCALDLLHLFLLAKQGFGMAKVGIAMLILLYDYKCEVTNYIKLRYKKWLI